MRNKLYNFIIDDLTYHCYENSLEYIPSGSSLLDVGIGNGVMIKKYHDLIRSKDLSITGIDINDSYINHCDRLIKEFNLEDKINVYRSSIESYTPPRMQLFDYVLFSMSFMLFNDQHYVLDKIREYLKPDGEIIFFQTIFKKKMSWVEFIKPRLKYVTTVDFGRVTYEKEFYALLDEKSLSVYEDRLIKKEWFKGEYRMIITSFKKNTVNKSSHHVDSLHATV